MVSGDCEKWMFAMQEEMQSLDKNGTWDIVCIHAGKKAVYTTNESSKERKVLLLARLPDIRQSWLPKVSVKC